MIVSLKTPKQLRGMRSGKGMSVMELTGLVVMVLTQEVAKSYRILPPCSHYAFEASGAPQVISVFCLPQGLPGNVFVISSGSPALISLFMLSCTLNSKFTMNSL